jgi:hypothetical protein
MSEYRLGDDIDDYCVRCKRLTNHLVVSVLDHAPAKVRCRTCHSDHDYRREQPPPPKVDLRKAALFNEVLKKVDPGAAPVLVSLMDHVAEPSVDPIVEEAAPPAPEPTATAKAKPKPKAKGTART